MVKFLKGQ